MSKDLKTRSADDVTPRPGNTLYISKAEDVSQLKKAGTRWTLTLPFLFYWIS